MGRNAAAPVFSSGDLEAVCKVLGDGLSNREIDHAFQHCRIASKGPPSPKWMRLFNALVSKIQSDHHHGCVLSFIAHSMAPARYSGNMQQFEQQRVKLNVPLAFVGLTYRDDGKFVRISPANTLSEAERKADQLKSTLQGRGVHREVLRYCRAELVADNYFHAVLEATKSVADQLRKLTGAKTDGAVLIDEVLSGADPVVRINPLSNESERSEQKGFVNLLKGVVGVFRNPTAHAPRIEWQMSEEDALDLLVLVSYAHRRLERAQVKRL